MDEKGYIRLAAMICIALGIAFAGYFFLYRKAEAPGNGRSVLNVRPFDPEAVSWRQYTDTDMGFSFSYPEVAKVIEEERGVTLRHMVPYIHRDPCDLQGGDKELTDLTDFSLTLRFFNTGISDAVKENSPYSADDIVKDGKVQLSAGYVDEFAAGPLTGYQITSGAEGCGMYEYYFPLSGGRTLYAKFPFVAEFGTAGGVLPDIKALALPGIIRKEWAQTYFLKILQSFTLEKPSAETMTLDVYFANPNKETTGAGCDAVFPVMRIVPKTKTTAYVALQQLFAGVSPQEKKEGYTTAFPEGSALLDISVGEGVAHVDLNEVSGIGAGSCSMKKRVSQIEKTLLQFPTISKVEITVGGRSEGIFVP